MWNFLVPHSTQMDRTAGRPFFMVTASMPLEAGLCLTLAERYRQACDAEKTQVLIRSAVENHPGYVSLYELERDFDPTAEIKWMDVVIPAPIDKVGEELDS